MLICAVHFQTRQTVDVKIENGKIAQIAPAGTALPDLQGGFVAPAFFDLQINGGGGHDFSSESLTLDKIRVVVALARRHGVGAFLPTLITNSHSALLHGFTTLRRGIESDAALAHALPGFHLEGPYISREDGPRGAHPLAHVRPPDWDEFAQWQDAAGGRIRLVTLAPEWDESLSFIEKAARSGVVVAIGHTAASPARIREAIRAGAKLSTHLGNGSHALLPRHENYLWEQLAADELWASIICDGHHLPPAILNCIVRVKTPARLILICDASSLAGLPPGKYREWGANIEILSTGKIVIPELGVMAGSSVFTDACVGNAVRLAAVSLADAVAMAGENPRALLGLPPLRLEAGMSADLTIFDLDADGRLQVKATIIGGEIM